MIRLNTPSHSIQFAYALITAILIILFIDARTNMIPPKWDALHYVKIAENGLTGNSQVAAPFAYRIGMPLMCRFISDTFSVSVERGFYIATRAFCLCFMIGIFLISLKFTDDYRHAIMTMIILSLYSRHIKFPLFFPTLVDVSAYALIVFAFWALITERFVLCLIMSCVGLLFKEWLSIPWILLLLTLTYKARQEKSWKNLIFLLISFIIGTIVIVVPRLCIPVSGTHQFIDPINDSSTLRKLVHVWYDELKLFNVMFSLASYWLPTLILMTPDRFHKLWSELKGFHLNLMVGHILLVLILTMYGGTNNSIFVCYSVAVQAIILVLLLQCSITISEIIYLILVMLFFNKILYHIPTPENNFDAYINHYGGWGSKVTVKTLVRFIEIYIFIVIAACIRGLDSKLKDILRCPTNKE